MKRATYLPAALAATAALAALSGCSLPTASAGALDGQGVTSGHSPETQKRNARDYEPAFPGQTRIAGVHSNLRLDVQTITNRLNSPWAVEMLPDGRYLVTERPGALRIVGRDGSISAPVQGLPAVYSKGQGGLLDVALDPDYPENHTIYFSYAEPREGGNGTALAKAVLVEDGAGARLEQLQVLFRQMPTMASDNHFGSRIVFAADDTLFLTLGERSVPAGRVQAQQLGSHLGKVIRINRDGSVPQDNPFVGQQGAQPEIWSYGHRNVQAATIDSATGTLWTIEHGPRGGDELNHPEAGKNYGWPVITYGIDYPGNKMGDGITQHEGMEQPVYYWDPVIAPSGMIVYQGDLFPQWKGSIFVGGLGSTKLVRLQMDGQKVVGEEWLLQDRLRRIRDVQQSSDGSIYVLTEAGEQSELLRLQPATT
ncbi:MAG: PQQ-dependent sugar dehydrogenase [Steroidobacteraceae bacterium]